MTHKILLVSIEEIQVSPHQPRGADSFDSVQLQELANSIKNVGLLQPPLVRPINENLYELIAGERRFRAAKLAGLKKIPVLVQSQNNLKSALSALIENIQREDLNPIDTALALKRLSCEFKLTHEEMAASLGMKRATLSNQLRLLALPKLIQKALVQKEISAGHAKVLLSLDSDQERLSNFQIICRDGLSVRETEAYLKQKGTKSLPKQKKASKKRNIFLQQIQETLQEKLGTKVYFSGDEKEGVLSFHYYNLSDLNRLLNEIGYSED